MRAVFGVLGLLITLAIVAVLAKKQMAVLAPTPVKVSVPMAGASAPVTLHQLPQQIGQTIENTLQQARPVADDK